MTQPRSKERELGSLETRLIDDSAYLESKEGKTQGILTKKKLKKDLDIARKRFTWKPKNVSIIPLSKSG